MPEHQHRAGDGNRTGNERRRHGEGSASDEPYEGYAEAERRLCPSISTERVTGSVAALLPIAQTRSGGFAARAGDGNRTRMASLEGWNSNH